MNKNHATYLKTITGVILIEKNGEELLCCLDDMQHTSHFTVGQLFQAVGVLYGKPPGSYGKLWPRYKNDEENVSKDWETVQAALANCDSDYDILIEVCKQLKEPVPEIVPKETVQKRLNSFKDNLFSIAQK